MAYLRNHEVTFGHSEVIKIPHCHRVLSSAVPQAALKHNIFASNPLARHTVSFFATNEWNYIQQLSSIYRGNFHLLPFSNDIDELGGKLSQYWFSVDHSVSSKGSPSHTLDSSNFPTSTASKVRTSTGFQVRSRWSASSGLIRTGQTVSETATVDFQSKNNVKLDKINSDTALSRSGSKSKDMVRTDGEAVNDSTTSCLSFDGKLCGNENVSCGYLESQLVICNHAMYQQYIHLLEGFLSSGSDKITNNIKLLFKNHDTTKYYCLRQLQIEELSESDRQKHSIQLTNERMRNLTVGLHVIAPCDWRASKVYSSSYENENVIF
ncbi:Dedicator of cytokinesis protein [Schistosoma japonicum]|nr:Dedicator of cytokinesis protein [Schistosoma japonicum]KAH8856043.1 Dedicator of cytokinesis protein [Schistosoma japonicum]KAH8856044.1 Dedicator of cytokinesis protein [Schistosoma japonicum]